MSQIIQFGLTDACDLTNLGLVLRAIALPLSGMDRLPIAAITTRQIDLTAVQSV